MNELYGYECNVENLQDLSVKGFRSLFVGDIPKGVSDEFFCQVLSDGYFCCICGSKISSGCFVNGMFSFDWSSFVLFCSFSCYDKSNGVIPEFESE